MNLNLRQNYPNPFNPSTTINYQIVSASKVKLSVFDMLGRKVADLVNEYQSAGNYNINFDVSTLKQNISSGIYLYRIDVSNSEGTFSDSRKMTLLK